MEYMYVHSVFLWKCVEPEALLKEHCWLPYLEKCKLCLQELEYVLYATVMLPRFKANHKLEKGKNFIRDFSK